MNLCGKSLISLKDFTPEEIRYFLDVAKKARDSHRKGIRKQRFLGMAIAFLFAKRPQRRPPSPPDLLQPEDSAGIW